MLIKITLILLVIDIALYIIARVYFNTLSAGNKFRIACTTNYKTGEKISGFTYVITFVIAVIAAISLIIRYL